MKPQGGNAAALHPNGLEIHPSRASSKNGKTSQLVEFGANKYPEPPVGAMLAWRSEPKRGNRSSSRPPLKMPQKNRNMVLTERVRVCQEGVPASLRRVIAMQA